MESADARRLADLLLRPVVTGGVVDREEREDSCDDSRRLRRGTNGCPNDNDNDTMIIHNAHRSKMRIEQNALNIDI